MLACGGSAARRGGLTNNHGCWQRFHRKNVPLPTARAFRAPFWRKKRGRLHAAAVSAGPTARTSRREVRRAHRPSECIRIARLFPVAQSSRRALVAPTARFAPHLRVALGLRPKCPLGTRFPPVPGGRGVCALGRKHSLRRFPPGSPQKEGEREAAQPRRKRSPRASFSDVHRKVIFWASSRRRVRA